MTRSSRPSRVLSGSLTLPLLVLAACGGGGGGGAPAAAGARLAGTVQVPVIAPALLVQEAEVRRPMVPGEVVVWLHDPAQIPDLTARGLDLVRSGGPIAVYRARASQTLRRLAEGAALADSSEYATCSAAAGLQGEPGVRCAEPNYLLQRLGAPNDEFFPLQWHLPLINLPQAWDVTQGSANVIVAVLDTGIVAAHPEFAGRLIPGFDMISDPASAGDGDGRDADPEDVGDSVGAEPSSFHGTHVAGTIGANGNNNVGVAGVDWNCKLMPVRVLGRGGGALADIADGILFAAGLANGSGQLPARRADIVNMSLGGPGAAPVLEQACNAAANAGVLLVVAAGNDNSAQPNTPAAFASVLSVGAVDLQRQRAPYSNFHTSIDLWAPGGDMSVDRNGDSFPDGVLSCKSDDAHQLFFGFENGTSMAAPHVAGVAALVKAVAPTLTAEQIRAILLGTATPVAGLPNNGVLVDALAAVLAAGTPPTTPILVAGPSVVDFGNSDTQAVVTLANRGAGTLTFVDATVAPAADWLDGNLVAATSGNISHDRVELTVNRAGLANGVYTTRATFEFAEGAQTFTTTVDFRLQVGGNVASSDELFVLLVDPKTFETRFQAQTNALAGFRYSLSGVTPGTYLLVAGTDRDNDDELGDEGELFGAFPSLDSPQTIDLTNGEVAEGADFALRQNIVINAASGLRMPRVLRRIR